MVTVASVDDLATFCIVQHLKQHETGHVPLSRLGEFLKNLFPSQLHSQLGKLRQLVESFPDELCSSRTTSYVSLRRGWPFPSLPDLVGEEGIDDESAATAVAGEDFQQTPVNLLRESASRYLKQRLKLKSGVGGLGAKAKASDRKLLVERINGSIRDHGILRIEVILAEIDEACHIRQVSEDAWFDQHCSIFASIPFS